MSYCHFVNCFGFVFEDLFSPLPLSFSCGLMSIFRNVFRLLFLLCVSIIGFWFVVPMGYSSLSICYYIVVDI